MADRAPGTCGYCGKPTRSEATAYCNGCYELRVRMGSDLARARRILEDLEAPVLAEMWAEQHRSIHDCDDGEEPCPRHGYANCDC